MFIHLILVTDLPGWHICVRKQGYYQGQVLTSKSIISRLEEIRDQITVVFAIDNLEFARMNGRVSALQERVISLLRIKPIIVLKMDFWKLLKKSEPGRNQSKGLSNWFINE